MYGNTHQIAGAIGRGLTEAHIPAEVVSVEAARDREIRPDDVLVVGAPTHVHGLSRESTRGAALKSAPENELEVDPSAQGPAVREWLASLGKSTGRAAAFDTRLKGPALFTGRASHSIAKALRRHGFELLAEPESFLVTSTNQLMPEEEARASKWGADLAAKIQSIQP
jgi:hypothetical protein